MIAYRAARAALGRPAAARGRGDARRLALAQPGGDRPAGARAGAGRRRGLRGRGVPRRVRRDGVPRPLRRADAAGRRSSGCCRARGRRTRARRPLPRDPADARHRARACSSTDRWRPVRDRRACDAHRRRRSPSARGRDVAVSYGGAPLLDERRPRASRPVRSSPCSAPAGRASPRCCGSSPACWTPDGGYVRWDGADRQPGCRRTAAGSGWCSRTRCCSRTSTSAGTSRTAWRPGRPARRARPPGRASCSALVGAARVRPLGRSRPCPAERPSGWRWPGPWRRAPRLLLLDEPFGALDRDLRDRLAVDVRDLLHRLGTPAVHVTHDLTEAELVADRVVRLVPTPAGAAGRCAE